MIVYSASYELADKDTGKWIITIPDIPIAADSRQEVLPGLQKMYPMYNVDLTTLHLLGYTKEEDKEYLEQIRKTLES